MQVMTAGKGCPFSGLRVLAYRDGPARRPSPRRSPAGR